jgi:hypothetical protein
MGASRTIHRSTGLGMSRSAKDGLADETFLSPITLR